MCHSPRKAHPSRMILTFTPQNRRVNPVERLYAAFPALLYMNASLGGAALAPLLESQDDIQNQAYASQDLGTSYLVLLLTDTRLTFILGLIYPVADVPGASSREGVERV